MDAQLHPPCGSICATLSATSWTCRLPAAAWGANTRRSSGVRGARSPGGWARRGSRRPPWRSGRRALPATRAGTRALAVRQHDAAPSQGGVHAPYESRCRPGGRGRASGSGSRTGLARPGRRRLAARGSQSLSARVPIRYPNPRDFPVNPGKPSWAPGPEKPRVCRGFRAGSTPRVLLAMQKVVGSNPISRSRKGLHLQVFFVLAVA